MIYFEILIVLTINLLDKALIENAGSERNINLRNGV